MRALVLSGGGVKGAWQAGALSFILGEMGLRYDIICGVSAGAINAAYLAQFTKEAQGTAGEKLESMWGALDTQTVYKRWRFWGRFAALWKPSVYDSSPLWAFLEKHLDRASIQNSGIKLCIGAVEMRTGAYVAFRESDERIVQSVMCSSAFPGVLRPYEMGDTFYTDGGVRNITPMADPITMGANEIDVLVTSPPDPSEFDTSKLTSMSVAMRAIEVMTDEILDNDLKVLSSKNEMVRHGITPDLRRIKVRVMRPLGELVKDSLKFEPSTIANLIHQGHACARGGWSVQI